MLEKIHSCDLNCLIKALRAISSVEDAKLVIQRWQEDRTAIFDDFIKRHGDQQEVLCRAA